MLLYKVLDSVLFTWYFPMIWLSLFLMCPSACHLAPSLFLWYPCRNLHCDRLSISLRFIVIMNSQWTSLPGTASPQTMPKRRTCSFVGAMALISITGMDWDLTAPIQSLNLPHTRPSMSYIPFTLRTWILYWVYVCATIFRVHRGYTSLILIVSWTLLLIRTMLFNRSKFAPLFSCHGNQPDESWNQVQSTGCGQIYDLGLALIFLCQKWPKKTRSELKNGRKNEVKANEG